VLNPDRSIPGQYKVFDVLAIGGESVTALSFARRRDRLEKLDLDGPAWMTPDTFDDGHALYNAVCERGFEGILAKWRRASYRPGQRGWIKVKNPAYWRRGLELAAMSKRRDPVPTGRG
jgi:bifunctional non-homologous end joining protein LigD